MVFQVHLNNLNNFQHIMPYNMVSIIKELKKEREEVVAYLQYIFCFHRKTSVKKEKKRD